MFDHNILIAQCLPPPPPPVELHLTYLMIIIYFMQLASQKLSCLRLIIVQLSNWQVVKSYTCKWVKCKTSKNHDTTNLEQMSKSYTTLREIMVDKNADWTKLWTLVSITFTTNIFLTKKLINIYIYGWKLNIIPLRNSIAFLRSKHCSTKVPLILQYRK